MRFDGIRVISNGNKYKFEFVYPKTNLLIKLLFMMDKTNQIEKSMIGDGAFVYVPDNRQSFVDAINDVKISDELNDIKINRYYLRLLMRNDKNELEQISVPMTFSELIRLASKKYKLPDYQINRFTHTCGLNRNKQIEENELKLI